MFSGTNKRNPAARGDAPGIVCRWNRRQSENANANVSQNALSALTPKELPIPDTVITLMAPTAGNRRSVELFKSREAPAFDDVGAARSLAQMIVDGILQSERAGRLVRFAPRERNALTLSEAIDSLVATTWTEHPEENAKLTALRRVTRRALTDRLLALPAGTQAAPEARAIDIGRWLEPHELPTPTPVAPPGDLFGIDP